MNIKEIMSENFPYRRQNIKLHIQEVQQVPSGINSKRSTPRDITIKLLKVKDKESSMREATCLLHVKLSKINS